MRNFPYLIIFHYLEKRTIVPKKILPFSKIFIVGSEDFDAYVHFFLNDVEFERFWKNPKKYLERLKKFAGVILPDFSVCYDFPYPLQLYNCYRNRVLGYILEKSGIPVIMNVSFGDSRTYDFCCNGIEEGGVIATGSLGSIKNREDRNSFIQGLKVVLERLKPSDLIIYGAVNEEILEVCKIFGTSPHVFTPEWDASFITKEALNGKR